MRASEKIAWAYLQNEYSNYTKYTICTTTVCDTINRMLTRGCKCIVTEAILQHAELPRPQPCHTPGPATHSRLKTKYVAEAANAHAKPCKILKEDNHATPQRPQKQIAPWKRWG